MGSNNEDYNVQENNIDRPAQIERVRNLVKKNRAAALGLAVLLTVSTTLTGCGCSQRDDDDDDSYYGSGGGGYHGGGYYFSRGSTYRQGSWSKAPGFTGGGTSGYSGKSYSSLHGGSAGG